MAALALASVQVVFIHVSPAVALPDCANRTHLVLGADASTAAGVGVNGVASAIHIPSAVSLNGQATSASDIVLIASDGNHFVQFGWYVGAAGALPYTSSPRLFFGQGSLTGGETLTPLSATVQPGTLRTFSMRRNENPASPHYKKVYAFLDGVQIFISAVHNYGSNLPRVVGETNWLCAEMTLDATEDAGPPYRTLRFHTQAGGYQYWLQHVNIGQAPWPWSNCWVNTRFNNETPTAFVYGPTC